MPMLFRIINTVVYVCVHVLVHKCVQHVASLQGSPVMKSMGLGRLVLYQKGGKLLKRTGTVTLEASTTTLALIIWSLVPYQRK